MNLTTSRHFLQTARRSLWATALVALAPGAQAQSAGCDQFRATLAARVDPSIKGFSLDIVRADAPLPAGAKVFGTCDGGAYKILFRRGGSTRPAAAEASAVAPAPALQVAPAPAVPPPPPAPPVKPATAPVPALTPQGIARLMEPAPAPAPPPESAAPVPAASVPTEVLAVAEEAQPASTAGFMDGKWQWLWALALLPFAAWLWAWVAHRRAYDEAGLPRGPKIRI
jgi:hypothetical protein